MPSDAGPHPAATVVVMRDSSAGLELFMVRRGAGPVFSGAHVFPGGRLDDSDRVDADERWCIGIEHAVRQLGELEPAEAIGYHVAAIRELFEEAGVLLARDSSGQFVLLRGVRDHTRFKQYRLEVHSHARTLRDVVEAERLRLALDALLLYAHWVTPAIEGRRFDTRFFVTRLPPGQVPAHDETETTGSAWISASEAIRAAGRHEMVLAPPTWTTLRELERFASVDEALVWTRGRRVARREPKLVEEDGLQMLAMPGDPLNPDADIDPGAVETRFVWSDGRWRPMARSEAHRLQPSTRQEIER